jgi:Flp pilus assembly protein TadG
MASEHADRGSEGEKGQAAVSFVAVVPLLVLIGLALAQFALAGHAAVSAATAARAAARASYTGSDPTRAARAALPPALREGAKVAVDDEGAEVEVRAPEALPVLPAIHVRGSAELGPEDGLPDG